MDSLVLELQRAASGDTLVSTLLRMAKVVAAKLDLVDTVIWLDQEMLGYPGLGSEEIPEYRKIYGLPQWCNPVLGWKPVVFEDLEEKADHCSIKLNTSVGQIESLVRAANQREQLLSIEVPPWLNTEGLVAGVHVRMRVDCSYLEHILSVLKIRVLDWSLALEKQGILGEGMTFSEQDKKQAASVSYIYNIRKIENFTGALGGNISQQNIEVT